MIIAAVAGNSVMFHVRTVSGTVITMEKGTFGAIIIRFIIISGIFANRNQVTRLVC